MGQDSQDVQGGTGLGRGDISAESKELVPRCKLSGGRALIGSGSTGFNCTDDENSEALALLRRRAWLALRAKIDEQTTDANMLVKLKLMFEERFRYDDDGVPRIWTPSDDIDAIFKKAKESVGGVPCSEIPDGRCA